MLQSNFWKLLAFEVEWGLGVDETKVPFCQNQQFCPGTK